MIKKSQFKKLENLPSQFFVELLGGEQVTWEAYGSDRKRLGRAILQVARKTGFRLDKSDNTCYAIVNYLADDLKVISLGKNQYEPVENWKDLVQGLFPKEVIEIKQPTKVEVAETEVSVEKAEEPKESTTAPKTLAEVYRTTIVKMGSDFCTSKRVEEILSEIHYEIYGTPAPKIWCNNRRRFLVNSALIEGIEDNGEIKYLVGTEWEKTLEEKESKYSKLRDKINPNPVSPAETTTPTPTAPIKEEVKEKVEEKKKEERTIVVSVQQPEDALKLFVKNVLMVDSKGTCVVELEPSRANLDVLKYLDGVEVNLSDRKYLSELYMEETKKLQDLLQRINQLTEGA